MMHPAFPGEGTPLGDAVTALLRQPDVSRAHWGIAVTALDGTPLYGLNEGQFFRPASNAKLFTTAAAMAMLGPERKFTTRVLGKLSPDGTVEGDLVLLGAGDANLASHDLPYVAPALRSKTPQAAPQLSDLAAMADQIVAKGVRHITGNVVGDDTLFPYEPVPQGWDVDDLVWGYGAPVSALTVADSQLTLRVTPGVITGEPGHQRFPGARVELEQFGVPYYTVEARVQTHPAGKASDVEVERLRGSRVLRVSGAIAADAKPDVEEVSIDDPAMFAAMALRQMLVERGVNVEGEAAPKHQAPWQNIGFVAGLRIPDGCVTMYFAGGACGGNHPSPIRAGTVLAEHVSAPLVDDVVFTAKVSQNLHAELLLHQMGTLFMSGYGSTLDGAQRVRGFATHAGVDPDDFFFYDGSGLSTHDIVTPRAIAQLLAFAATQPWFSQWKAALPVAGVDGSLASRYKDSPLKGKVFAKTGTLGETRALSGYLEAASGKTVIFSVLVDTHAPGASADREVMDRIVAAIAAAE